MSTNKITFYPNPLSKIIPEYKLHYIYIGRIIAKSLIMDWNCEVDLSRSFLKHILRKDLYISDLEDIDADLTKNLLWILENSIDGTDHGLTFSY